jgi:hypothetical protein
MIDVKKEMSFTVLMVMIKSKAFDLSTNFHNSFELLQLMAKTNERSFRMEDASLAGD